ncbi:MAG TPA: discoidin domain-containing protein, partial [Asanoa sp.]|nr:discoidin domain-containing protein [Asanoa sp.]
MATRPSRRVIAGGIVASVVAGLSLHASPAQAATPTPDQQWAAIQSLLANIKGRWTDQSYVNSIVNGMPSTALLGNGDIGVTSAGSTGVKTFLVSKGNFWRGNPGPAVAPVGGVTLAAASGGTGSTNLALGATATATSSHPSFPPARAVSGQWGSGYEGWVSNVGKPQTLTLDLGTAKTFTRYIVRHDSAARPAETANNTKNFQVQTSTDNQNWSTWDTVTNNTAGVTDRTLASRTARWVRLVTSEPTQGTTTDSQQNPRARIGQFELYGAGGGPGGPGGTFLEEQNILRGEVDTTMSLGGQPLVLKTWVAANDNLLVTQIRSTGTAAVRLEARTWSGATSPMGGFTQTAGVSGNTTWAARTTPSGSR